MKLKARHGKSESLRIGRPGLARLNQTHIRGYVGHLFMLGRSKRTIHRHLAAAKSFFRYLFEQGLRPDNPSQLVAGPKLDKKTPIFLTVEEAFSLIEAVPPKSSFFAARDRAILELLYSSGVRVSELCSLSLFDIDLKSGQIRVKGKGSRQRVVPVGNAAREALRRYIRLRARTQGAYRGPASAEEKALFLNRYGRRISTRAVNGIVHKYSALSAIPKDIGPHKLRHTCATHLYDAGMDLRDLQELLGHRKISSTSIYTHTSIERLKKVYSRAHPRA